MTTLLPTSQSTGVEAYDDMFKEITRKLYGDESAHGLYPHNTQVAQLAPGAPTAPPDGGERSFTTLTQIGYETTTVGAGSAAASGESASQQQSGSSSAASTAFGLAALMQNGFPPPGAILNPVNFAPGTSKTPTNISTPSSDNRWQSQHAADESWSTGKHSSTSGGYGGKSYKKPKTEPQDGGSSSLNIPSTADRTSKGGSGYGSGTAQGTTSSSSSSGTPQAYKRYSCTTCPYTTDRRDLFTRHENIHKDEKPFQCYACLKPFNRADHVKKHFLRMHRELEYDIAKTRRYPPSSSSASNASNKNTYYGHASQSANGAGTSNSAAATNSTSTTATQPPMQLNIPSGNFGSSSAHSLTIPSNVHESVSALQHHIAMSGINGGHSAGQLLQLHNLHHQQQQQQQQQHNVHHPSISIKQEKGLASGGSSHNTSASSAGGSPDEKSFVKKIKGEKKFACTFCPWAGTDNWGLKRHLNTHTKPYVCLLCDYKAARSERLATHVLKVHNKKACGKCSFFAEDQAHLDAHLQEAHPHDPTKASKHTGTVSGGNGGSGNDNCDTGATHHPGGAAAANGNVLRNLGNAFTSNNLPTNIPTSGNGFGAGSSANGHYHTAGGHHAATGNVLTNSNAANLIDTINQHLASTGPNGSAASASSLQHHQQQHLQQHWMGKPHRKRNGAELLYSYLEADGSDSGDYARLLHMQAVGRNKASVTQDFHNAGGGDNGINGDHSSSNGSSTNGASANPLFAVATADRLKKETQEGAILANGSSQSALAKANDSVALSLASLLGGDQLSFLQLLATAAVAHQQLQLHSSQQPGPYGHGGLQKKQQQQQHQSQPKPSKAAAVHQAVVGAPNGDRYGSMVSSPPATGTHQQHPRPAATASSTSTKNSTNSTNGTSIIIPSATPASTSGTTITNSPTSTAPAAVYATESGGGGFKKRRLNGSSSSDKENLLHRKGHAAGANPILQGAASSVSSNIIVNGGSGSVNGANNIVPGHQHTSGSKIGHTHYHNHHHNNNNTSTSNKNINDIFDKVYKKPQNSFVSTKQQQQLTPPAAHSLPPSLLRIAPPSAVEEESNRPSCPVVIETEGQQFSLTEFLKNHTEVSISTVDAGGKGSEDKELADLADEAANDSSAPTEVSLGEKQMDTPAVVPLKKRKSEGERNPRKQQQPRRFDDSDGDTVPVKLALEEKPLVTVEPTVLSTPIAVMSQEDTRISKLDPCEAIETSGSSDESCVSRLADIRDKHMTQLVSRRRCCRICQNQGRLDHLDNYHYHSKISLILHTLWRHGCDAGSQELRCHQCGSQFRQRYKLALHKRLMKHTGSAAGRKQRQKKSNVGTLAGEGKRSNGKENLATNGAHTNGSVPVKSSSEQKKTAAISLKKQRKRKPRSRCFTPRRRK
uniref:C2H2-type domain-containing protein n=1 Tax=Anopheles atroparvus TaxID=41427 RepID=A0AAG5DKD6_ANOAO